MTETIKLLVCIAVQFAEDACKSRRPALSHRFSPPPRSSSSSYLSQAERGGAGGPGGAGSGLSASGADEGAAETRLHPAHSLGDKGEGASLATGVATGLKGLKTTGGGGLLASAGSASLASAALPGLALSSGPSASSSASRLPLSARARAYMARAAPMAVPAGCFVFQQVLLVIAASNLDAVAFQIFSQSFKLVPTAVFAYLILGQSLTVQQWISIPVLSLGVVLVSTNGGGKGAPPAVAAFPPPAALLGGGAAAALGGAGAGAAADAAGAAGAALAAGTVAQGLANDVASAAGRRLLVAARGAVEGGLAPWAGSAASAASPLSSARRLLEAASAAATPRGAYLVGVVACSVSGLSSAFAGVYFEKYVKGRNAEGLIPRNIQLGLFGVPFSAALVVARDGRAVARHGLLQGFDAATWSVVALQVFGGLVTGMVVKYCDNVLKNFALAISVVLTVLLAIPIFGIWPSKMFVLGVALVLLSVFLYGRAFSSRRVAALLHRARAARDDPKALRKLLVALACALAGSLAVATLLYAVGRDGGIATGAAAAGGGRRSAFRGGYAGSITGGEG